jgi:hypothetical protein
LGDSDKVNEEYKQYIESPEWQAKRTERLKIDNFTCQRCGSTRGLQVHHINYTRFKNENVYEDLITLCFRCHAEIERAKLQKDNDLQRKRDEETEKRKQWIATKDIKTYVFIQENKKRDIGFGGKENLCDYRRLKKALNENGIDKEEVHLSFITRFFTFKRWKRVLQLHSRGLT